MPIAVFRQVGEKNLPGFLQRRRLYDVFLLSLKDHDSVVKIDDTFRVGSRLFKNNVFQPPANNDIMESMSSMPYSFSAAAAWMRPL